MSVEVHPVSSRRELREFIGLPYRLHSNAGPWVPPLRLERRLFLSPRFNAFFTHGEAQLFLARRDGRVVGRVSAHVDRAFNDFHANAWGWFGFLELEQDQQALDALLAAAGGWLRERGSDRMVGPADFTMNDESGIVIEGFDREPLIKQPWHPPYYRRLCEAAGLEKAMDLISWYLHIAGKADVLPVIWELAERAEAEHGIEIRHMTRRGLRRDLDAFAEVYNAAWSGNWGFVPYSKQDLDHYARELQLVFDPHWFMVAERDGEAVGVAITVPDINPVLKRMNGRLLPLGWWHYLRRRRTVQHVRVGFLGVKPEYQHAGVAAALYAEHYRMAEAQGSQVWGEAGWILETNTAMNRALEAMGARAAKRYRVYERRLA